MIESIKLKKQKSWQPISFVQPQKHKVELEVFVPESQVFTVQITFKNSIVSFRDSDYSWQNILQRRLSNWYAPKIIKLETEQIIQANQHNGIWEVNPENPKILLWHFNIPNSSPLSKYESDNGKLINQATSDTDCVMPLALLLPSQNGMEMSRSKFPFSAIACFTDHCDFDNLASLNHQRIFFKKYRIKVTKGFFLNHFSKRPDTASNEFHHSELKAWLADGHELAYHSLSQSIKPFDESFKDFKNFEPPFKDIATWIDHGFQPYNVSQYHNHKPLANDYASVLNSKGINIIWNYIDSGTATMGVINQMNPAHFNLRSYYNGITQVRLKNRIPMLIKNILFHFYNTDESLRLYGSLAKFYKTRKKKKTFGKYVTFFQELVNLISLLVPVMLFWKEKRSKTYPLAEYNPVMFRHDINGNRFTVFQTLEMIDFRTGLHPSNIDLLIKESGLFIAHTYFSAPMNYHQGRMFKNDLIINQQVETNFDYISKKIESRELWNPTLKELVSYLEKFRTVTFDCDDKGQLLVKNNDYLLDSRAVR
ncbi:MAG: hypothetical protein ACSHXF_13305 [Aquaticitalea sp.]